MATFDTPEGMLDALSAPLGDLIASVGESVAQAQRALDLQTIENFKIIYGSGEEAFEALRGIGYQPTWYQIPEAQAEISIALTISGAGLEAGEGVPGGRQRLGRVKLFGAPIDAGYASRYNYDLRASSALKFKVVPVPPSVQASEMKVVPDVVSMTFAQGSALLDGVEVPYGITEGAPEPKETDIIVGTVPGPGELLPPGGILVLELAAPAE